MRISSTSAASRRTGFTSALSSRTLFSFHSWPVSAIASFIDFIASPTQSCWIWLSTLRFTPISIRLFVDSRWLSTKSCAWLASAVICDDTSFRYSTYFASFSSSLLSGASPPSCWFIDFSTCLPTLTRPLPTNFSSFIGFVRSSFSELFVSAFSSSNFSSSDVRNERTRLLSFSSGLAHTERMKYCSALRRSSTKSISKRFSAFFCGIGGITA